MATRSPEMDMPAFLAICERIADGMSIRAALADADAGCIRRFFYFVNKHEDARRAYDAAREIRAELWAEELIDIADQDNPKNVKRDALRVSARQWVISKHLPKTYGNKSEVELSGGLKLTHEQALDELE